MLCCSDAPLELFGQLFETGHPPPRSPIVIVRHSIASDTNKNRPQTVTLYDRPYTARTGCENIANEDDVDDDNDIRKNRQAVAAVANTVAHQKRQ